jgi:hypothetical protein
MRQILKNVNTDSVGNSWIANSPCITLDKDYNVVYKSKGLSNKSEVSHAIHMPLLQSGPSPPGLLRSPGIFAFGNIYPHTLDPESQGGRK